MNKEEIKEMLRKAHHSTFRNEKQIKDSDIVGCFFCERIYKPSEVDEWWDNDGRGDPTGVCPYCGIDSVLGNASGMIINPSLMRIMKMMFFEDGIDDLKIRVDKINEKYEKGTRLTIDR